MSRHRSLHELNASELSKKSFVPETGVHFSHNQVQDENEDYQHVPSALRIKIISMGESGVGKSCVIKRYCEEKFVSKYISTIGIDYGVKPVQINGEEICVNFWDFSGVPEFLEVRNEFYQDTQGGILMFDLTSRSSFDALDSWLDEASKFGASKFPCIVCGNKSDRRPTVSTEEGRLYAEKRGFKYFETSACTGENINEAFNSLFQRVVSNIRA